VRPGKKHLVWVYRWTRGFEFALPTDALTKQAPPTAGLFLFLGEAECGEPIKQFEAAWQWYCGGATRLSFVVWVRQLSVCFESI
jgi:hypothetical protein